MGATQGQGSAWPRSTVVARMGPQRGAGGLRLVPVTPNAMVEGRKREERSERGSSSR